MQENWGQGEWAPLWATYLPYWHFPNLLRAVHIPSDHEDKRNLVLSNVAGNGCVGKPSPCLPCQFPCGMGRMRPALPPTRDAGMSHIRECELPEDR